MEIVKKAKRPPTLKYYPYYLIKQEVKFLMKNITVWRNLYQKAAKDGRTYVRDTAHANWSECSLKFRTLHIAYCLSKGRTYEQIEKTATLAPNWKSIEEIKGWIERALVEVGNGKQPDVAGAPRDLFNRLSTPEDLLKRNREENAKFQASVA